MTLIIRDSTATYTKWSNTIWNYPIVNNLAALYDFGSSAGGLKNQIFGGTQPTVAGAPVQASYAATLNTANSLDTNINATPIMTVVGVGTFDRTVNCAVCSNAQGSPVAGAFAVWQWGGTAYNTTAYNDAGSGFQTSSLTSVNGLAPTFVCGVVAGTSVRIYVGRNNAITRVASTASFTRTTNSTTTLKVGRDNSATVFPDNDFNMVAIHTGYGFNDVEVNSVYQSLRTLYAARGITNL